MKNNFTAFMFGLRYLKAVLYFYNIKNACCKQRGKCYVLRAF